MIQDEIIAKINFYNSDCVREALRAIVQLHQQLEDNSCHHCVTWYPCSTIQAIEKELHNGTH